MSSKGEEKNDPTNPPLLNLNIALKKRTIKTKAY